MLGLLLTLVFAQNVPQTVEVLAKTAEDLAKGIAPGDVSRFDARLTLLASYVDGLRGAPPEQVAAGLRELRKRALVRLEAKDPVVRMFALRSYALVSRCLPETGQAHARVTERLADPNRLVRREAVLHCAIASDASERDGWLLNRGLLKVIASNSDDADLRALAERRREYILGWLKQKRRGADPAPGGVAVVTRPRRRAPRFQANEAAACATLLNLISAQAQFRACRAVDTDRDRVGEYGFFGELTGCVPLRSDEHGGVGKRKLSPPVLSGAFANVRSSVVTRGGYCFEIFLPDTDSLGRAEAERGGAAGVSIAADNAERAWFAYAWPQSYGTTGRRVFFVSRTGDVVAAANYATRYEGLTARPRFDAALISQKPLVTMRDRMAVDWLGRDGNYWHIVR